jgi:mRNA interferase MazF
MGTFAAGQVVLVNFPFSDLTASKMRPAIILAEAGRGDWVPSQITSKPYGDPIAVQLENSDFAQGSLRLTSYARPGKLFTAHFSLIAGKVASLRDEKFIEVRDAIIRMLQTSAGKA